MNLFDDQSVLDCKRFQCYTEFVPEEWEEYRMIEINRFALNRIIAPRMGLRDFIDFAVQIGIHKIELRNDLPGKTIIDHFSPQAVKKLCNDTGVSIITIYAVQKFNLKTMKHTVREELNRLLELATDISCPALILCPNNDPADRRTPEERKKETIEALTEFAPLFQKARITGLIEPLGFRISSLASALEAVEMIRESSANCYKVTLDTFHYYLGPDKPESLGTELKPEWIGLVHVSGVEDPLPPEKILDEHRVLPSEKDRLQSKEQVHRLITAGYTGDISFEPFGSRIQNLPPEELKKKLKESIEYLSI
jgi:2-keto-myo-inositol isomerase